MPLGQLAPPPRSRLRAAHALGAHERCQLARRAKTRAGIAAGRDVDPHANSPSDTPTFDRTACRCAKHLSWAPPTGPTDCRTYPLHHVKQLSPREAGALALPSLRDF